MHLSREIIPSTRLGWIVNLRPVLQVRTSTVVVPSERKYSVDGSSLSGAIFLLWSNMILVLWRKGSESGKINPIRCVRCRFPASTKSRLICDCSNQKALEVVVYSVTNTRLLHLALMDIRLPIAEIPQEVFKGFFSRFLAFRSYRKEKFSVFPIDLQE